MQDAAKDVLAQETISKEVTNFMAKSGSMQEEDLGALEDTIRTALTGRTPPCALLALAPSSQCCVLDRVRAVVRRCGAVASGQALQAVA